MSTVPKFRIDVNVHSLLMNSTRGPELPANQGLTLPEPIYPGSLRSCRIPDPRHLRKGVTGRLPRPIAR